MTHRTSFALILLLCSGHSLASSLSFEQARQQMLQHSASHWAQDLDVSAWQHQQQALKWLNRPQVELNLMAMHSHKDLSLDLPPPLGPYEQEISQSGVRSQVQMRWPLYAGGRIQASQEQAHFRVQQAQAERQQHENRLTQQLAERYFGLQLAQQALSIQQQALTLLADHRHQAERFAEQGQISRLQSLQAQVAHDQALRQKYQAERQLGDAQLALSSLLPNSGQCLATGLQISDQALTPSDPLDQVKMRAVQQHPGLERLRALEGQANQQVRIEQSKFKPDIFGFAQAELNAEMQPLEQPDWALGLGLRWQLSSGVGRREMNLAAQDQLARTQALQQQGQLDVHTQLEIAQARLLHSQTMAELLASDIALARENARLQALAFEANQATSLDVSSALLEQSLVELALAQAQYDHIMALADWLLAQGDIQQLDSLLTSNFCTY